MPAQLPALVQARLRISGQHDACTSNWSLAKCLRALAQSRADSRPLASRRPQECGCAERAPQPVRQICAQEGFPHHHTHESGSRCCSQLPSDLAEFILAASLLLSANLHPTRAKHFQSHLSHLASDAFHAWTTTSSCNIVILLRVLAHHHLQS